MAPAMRETGRAMLPPMNQPKARPTATPPTASPISVRRVETNIAVVSRAMRALSAALVSRSAVLASAIALASSAMLAPMCFASSAVMAWAR